MTRARGLTAALAVLGLGGCDALLVDPAPQHSLADVRLALTQGDAAQTSYGDLTGPLQAVRYARFELLRDGGTRDTVAGARVDDGTVSVRLILRPEEARGWLTIQAELWSGNQLPLFRGNGLLQAYELAPATTIGLTPVAGYVVPTAVQTLSALGDTVALSGQVQFANAIPIPGAVIQWETVNPTIAEVVQGDRLVPRSNGTTMVRGSALGATGQTVVVVRQTAVSLTGVGPADTTVAVGASFRARPFGQDPDGFPLLPGAAVEWSARGVVSVNSQGMVTAQSAGSGFVDATLGNVVHTAQVTVTP